MGHPNFLGIGGHKTASTWMYMALREHPQVFMADLKETHYFSMCFDKGEGWYRDLFRHSGNAKAVGEFSTSYYWHWDALERIHAFNPDFRFLMIVRDPVDRTISHYRHNIMHRYTDLPFDEAVAGDPELTGWSEYGARLQPFIERFGRERFHIVRKDAIERDPAGVLRGVFEFLGVDPGFESSYVGKTVGRTITPRVQALEIARDKIFRFVHGKGMHALVPWIRRTGLPALYRKLNDKPSAPVATERQRAALRERYAPDLRLFIELTGVDVSDWLPEAQADTVETDR